MASPFSATSHVGIFYGIQSVMKALPITQNVKSVSLPAAEVTDSPRFAYRAFMIDVGSHYFSVPYLKKLIDVFAMHNINYFHWHLTQDQGWRLEIKKYPMLTQIGSKRKETILPTNKNEFDGVPVSGYYTQEEAREIVKYATEPIHHRDSGGGYAGSHAGCPGAVFSFVGLYRWSFTRVTSRLWCVREMCLLCWQRAGPTLQFAKDVMDGMHGYFPIRVYSYWWR